MKNLTQSEKLFMLFQRGAIFVGRGRQPQHGGGHGQNYVLSLLAEAPLSQKELLEKLGVRAGSLSELLSKLENAGYITRSKDENDSRVVNIEITEAGRTVAAEHGHHRTEVADNLFAALSDEEKATLISLLEKLHNAWKSEREAGDAERRERGQGRRGFGGGFPAGHGFGGFRGGFEKAPPDEGDKPAEHGHHGHGHSHGAEITDPELKAHLETLNCDGCDKNCKLSAPHCGKGAKKQQDAIEEFKKG
ncbi:MAG: MarR family winged helix-turn-helix transcriptional regulator [Oscillospiraceae bacterium]|jgi:DNA-binding MarR family transcriptional regulator|nr:MarR family winged helix-turn-helix transcriptional regulator [Oscillospiraceae bacterium]